MNEGQNRADGAVIVVRAQKKYIDLICKRLQAVGVTVTIRTKVKMWMSLGVIMDIDCGRTLRTGVVPVLERTVNECRAEGVYAWTLAYAVWLGKGYSETYVNGSFHNFANQEAASADKMDRVFVDDINDSVGLLAAQGLSPADVTKAIDAILKLKPGSDSVPLDVDGAPTKGKAGSAEDEKAKECQPNTLIKMFAINWNDAEGVSHILGRAVLDPITHDSAVSLPEVAMDRTDMALARKVFQKGIMVWASDMWIQIGYTNSESVPEAEPEPSAPPGYKPGGGTYRKGRH